MPKSNHYCDDFEKMVASYNTRLNRAWEEAKKMAPDDNRRY